MRKEKVKAKGNGHGMFEVKRSYQMNNQLNAFSILKIIWVIR